MSEDVNINETPLSESEKEQLSEVVQLGQQLQSAFGNLSMRKIQIESEEEVLKQELSKKNQKEAEISRKINEKYGVGSVDLQKGVFIKQD
jgi:iron-sulfur cluster repair protein YtfE (RIC family)